VSIHGLLGAVNNWHMCWRNTLRMLKAA